MSQPLVLLVPADRLTGMTTAGGLEAYGYEVVATSNVEEARDLLRTNGRISVLVVDTDLRPAHDGLAFAKAARASDPDLKVIYTSRLPSKITDAEKVSGAPCVQTPYRPHQLAGVISQLVRRHAIDGVVAYAA
jgi:CheY-like chemotaxis protein